MVDGRRYPQKRVSRVATARARRQDRAERRQRCEGLSGGARASGPAGAGVSSYAMALHVHNTLTKQRELFEPAHPKVVRIYTCGLTTYAPMHIGHARTYCFWDLFRRYLEYGGRHVISVINYTDIDDRIIDRAKGGEGPVDLSERII